LPKFAEVIQAQWAAIGVRAKLNVMDWGQYSKERNQIKSKRFAGQVATHRMTGYYYTPANMQSIQYYSGGLMSGLQYAFPEIDRLIEAADTALDAKERNEYQEKIVPMVNETYAFAPIAGEVPMAMCAIGPKVTIDLPQKTFGIGMVAPFLKHK
jgi:ABC-type transport system substrate-binding protein